jgi:hypothetical protein
MVTGELEEALTWWLRASVAEGRIGQEMVPPALRALIT